MSTPTRIYSLAEQEAALRMASYDELAVGLFVGKLHQLIEAGVDFGISTQQLDDLLAAINIAYELLTAPNDGEPN